MSQGLLALLAGYFSVPGQFGDDCTYDGVGMDKGGVSGSTGASRIPLASCLLY
jgi:hypothetical protein